MEPNEKNKENESNTVTIPVWDMETGEIINMEISQEALDAMDEADREFEEHQERAREKERQNSRFDDY